MFKNWGKRNKYGTAPKRIDRTQTRQPFLDDSDEESLASTTSVSSESEFESYPSGSDASDDSDSDAKRKSSESSGDSSESEEKVVSRKSRKRSATSAKALNDSSSDSDSDVEVPVRKKDTAKRFKRIKTDEDTKQTDAKRKERQRKLAELVQRRKQGVSRARKRRASPEKTKGDEPEGSAEAGTEEKDEEKYEENEEREKEEKKEKEEDSEEDAAPTMIRSSDEDSEDDSLKDFIVEDEKGPTGDGEDTEKTDVLSQLPSEFITRSPLIHFQVVVKSLLINALDENFLKSLYSGERTKRYALEMKDSLIYFDERLVLPRLENLKLRSRWKERYKDRVECYPEVNIKLTESGRRCEACELDRTGRFYVVLSGQLYHAKTLQEDQFLPEDKQRFCVGSVCASRTEVYHALKHFKYHLFVGCRAMIEEHAKKIKDGEQGDEEEPVKETVKKVFAALLQNGWINEQYDSLQEHLNKADYFQEEKLD